MQNSRKARLGQLGGLQDPATIDTKRVDEKKLRDAAAADPKLKDDLAGWDEVTRAIAAAELDVDTRVLERRRSSSRAVPASPLLWR